MKTLRFIRDGLFSRQMLELVIVAAGTGCIVGGLAMIYPPLGWIFLGAILLIEVFTTKGRGR